MASLLFQRSDWMNLLQEAKEACSREKAIQMRPDKKCA